MLNPNGITPAYAGKRFDCLSLSVLLEDHPRVCGEKGKLIPFYVDEVGSPPRMRGKATMVSTTKLQNGITPAYAGKSIWEYPQK